VYTGAIIMGFGGGGGGALPNHEHTNIALDGGPLDFANTTIASLSNGSITYSNGAALQELTPGGANTVLQIAAGLPSWQTLPLASSVLTTAGDLLEMDNTPSLARIPAGNLNDVLTMGATLPQWSPVTSSAVFELVDYTKVGSTTTTINTSFTSIPRADISELLCYCSGANGGFDIGLQVNGITTSDYATQGSRYAGGETIIGTSGQSGYDLVNGTAFGNSHFCVFHIMASNLNNDADGDICIISQVAGATAYETSGGVIAGSATSDFTSVKIGLTGSNSMEAGSWMSIYKVLNS